MLTLDLMENPRYAQPFLFVPLSHMQRPVEGCAFNESTLNAACDGLVLRCNESGLSLIDHVETDLRIVHSVSNPHMQMDENGGTPLLDLSHWQVYQTIFARGLAVLIPTTRILHHAGEGGNLNMFTRLVRLMSQPAGLVGLSG